MPLLRRDDYVASPESRIAYLEERVALQTLVIADLVEACGHLVQHCNPDRPIGPELIEARAKASVVIRRYGIRTKA